MPSQPPWGHENGPRQAWLGRWLVTSSRSPLRRSQVNLDPRVDCLIKMSDPERQFARGMARHGDGLLTDSAEARTAPVAVRVFVQLTDAAASRPGELGIAGVTPRSQLGVL